jgi:hypothetical protein
VTQARSCAAGNRRQADATHRTTRKACVPFSKSEPRNSLVGKPDHDGTCTLPGKAMRGGHVGRRSSCAWNARARSAARIYDVSCEDRRRYAHRRIQRALAHYRRYIAASGKRRQRQMIRTKAGAGETGRRNDVGSQPQKARSRSHRGGIA